MLLAGPIVAGLIAGGAPALAQVRPSQPASGVRLEEVVVTAQKREEKLQNVPVSVVSRSAKQLERGGVTNSLDLVKVVPGLLLNRVGAPTAPAIRGVSTKVVSPGEDANVATYVDGFYQTNTVALNRTLLDVASIDVLRGPQGTLFGRNATGGAILITTRTPSFTPQLMASASFEQNNGQKYVLYASDGIGDKAAFSLSGFITRSDGWLRNVGGPGFNFPSAPQRSDYIRGRALFKPTHDVDLDFSIEHGMMQDGTATAFSYVAHPTSPFFPALHTDPTETSLSQPAIVRDEWNAGYATITWNLPWATLKSLTQIREDRSPWSFDLGGVNAVTVPVRVQQSESTQTEEINLTSRGETRFQWIAGAFYFHDKSDNKVFTSRVRYGNETTAWAGYLDGTLRVWGDRLFLTGGVRYSEEEKICLFAPVPVGGHGPLARCLGGDPVHHEYVATPRAVVRYQIEPNTNVYVSYSQGFKSGGFNDFSAANPYEPEKINAWEIGFKTAQERYRLDLSAFHYDYKNLQFAYACPVAAPPVCPVAAGTVTTNAAVATAYGAEAELTWAVAKDFNVDAGLAYLHTNYDRFLNASAAAPTTATSTPPCLNPNPLLCRNITLGQDWSGQRLIRAPEWSLNLGATYDVPTPVGVFELSGNLYYVSEYQSDTDSLPCTVINCGVGLSPRRTIPAHTLMDMTLAWHSPDRHYEVAVYARNLFDESYLIRADASALGDTAIGGEPRVVGVRLRYSN
jgi:iron complex outermembrane receptor protein